MPKLFAQSGHSLDLPDREVVFGSSINCDIPLTAEGLIERHFVIGHGVLRDLSGRNPGTLVNGELVDRAAIHHGDVISVGSLKLGYWNPAPEPRSGESGSPFLAGSVYSGPAPLSLSQTGPTPAAGNNLGLNLPPLQSTPLATPISLGNTPLVLPSITSPVPLPEYPIDSRQQASAPVPLDEEVAFVPQETAPVAAPVPSRHTARVAADAHPNRKPAPPKPPRVTLASAPIPAPTPFSAPEQAPAAEIRSAPVPLPPPLPQARSVEATPPLPAPPEKANTTAVPTAWMNPLQVREAVNQPAERATGTIVPVDGGLQIQAPPLKMRKKRRVLVRHPGAIAAITILTGIGAWSFTGSGQESIRSFSKQAADYLRPAEAAEITPTEPGQSVPGAAAIEQQASAADSLLPQSDHRDIIKSFLTERTTTLCYADLKQLMPYYNNMASGRSLPAQREMSEAFHKHYGIFLEGFDQFTCLRGTGKDEFLFILSAEKPVNVEAIFGIPKDRYQAHAFPASRKQRLPRPHQVTTAANLPLSAGLYDPYTLILGKKTWVDSIFNGDGAPGLREATCLFPVRAFKEPGALIMVERLAPVEITAGSVLYETSVSNLFLRSKGNSTLTLTRHPEAKTEDFVDQASAALKQQAAQIASAVQKSAEPVLKAKSGTPDPVETQETINDSEATIPIPAGEALIAQAIEGVARTFMSKSPMVELILSAHDAVINFNKARQTKADEAMRADTVPMALQLLMTGINGGGALRERVFRIPRIEPAQMESFSSLLAMEEKVGLVFRPNADKISPAISELAMKARDYRNAELVASLWIKSGIPATEATDAATAVNKAQEWGKGEGINERSALGLPVLTDGEVKGVLKLISMQNGKLSWKPGEAGYRSWLRNVGGKVEQAQIAPGSAGSIEKSGGKQARPFQSLKEAARPARVMTPR